MTVEILVVIFVGVVQITGLTVLGAMLYRMWEQTSGLGSATFLQGRQIKVILEELREELARSSPGT